MKIAEKHISTFLVSIAIFLVFGNIAFGSEMLPDKTKANEISFVQADEGAKPFVFDELSIRKVSQTVSQNEYSGLGLYGIFYSNKDFFHSQASPLFSCSYSLEDKRKLIFQYLYPFHFFW